MLMQPASSASSISRGLCAATSSPAGIQLPAPGLSRLDGSGLAGRIQPTSALVGVLLGAFKQSSQSTPDFGGADGKVWRPSGGSSDVSCAVDDPDSVEYRFALLYNHRFTASYAPDWKIFKSTLEEQKSLMPISTVLSRNITIPRWTAHASARSQASRSRSETRSPSMAYAAR